MRSRTWSLTLAAIAILSFVIALAWFLIAPGFEPLLALLTGVATLLGSFVVRETPKGGEGDAIQKPLFRYRAHYLQHLIYRHRSFDVKGLTTQGVYTLELQRVFVELRVGPQPAHKTSTDSLRALPPALRSDGHVIWEYLQPGQGAGQHLAVIGAPGSGKTTLLKHMMLTLAASRKQRRMHGAPDKLPILLFLRDHASVIAEAMGGESATVSKRPVQVPADRRTLRGTLAGHFDERELRDLCFDLGVDYENLPPGTKSDKARELVAYCERHERLEELARVCTEHLARLEGEGGAARVATPSGFSLVDAVRDSLARWRGPAAHRGWFERQLRKGRCLVMLDGLDEVVDAQARKQVVEWVERQMVAYPRNSFVVTSRPFGYRSNPLSKATVLEVQPFARAQVRRFVDNWYLANEVMSNQKDDPGVRMQARAGAEDLLRRLRSTPDLLDLAVNPLLLTMIATVHRYRSSLPGRRVELYAEMCEVFLGKRQAARGVVSDLTPAQKQRVLEPLAYHLMRAGRREIPLAEAMAAIAEPLARVAPGREGSAFLKEIENGSGVLLERESGVYGFAHQTFQEYLASTHAQEQRLGHALTEQVEESWWHETIRLYAARADATPILEACLAQDPLSAPALTLAIDCAEEAREIQLQVRAQLERLLAEEAEGEDPERRRIVAEALLARRLRRMVRLDEDRYADNSLITHTEYQLFLDERRAKAKYHHPDHWAGVQFPEGQGKAPVVGVRYSDARAFCEWLTERGAGEWQYRLPLVYELDPGDVARSQADLPVGGGYWAQPAPGGGGDGTCRRLGERSPSNVKTWRAGSISRLRRPSPATATAPSAR